MRLGCGQANALFLQVESDHRELLDIVGIRITEADDFMGLFLDVMLGGSRSPEGLTPAPPAGKMAAEVS
jgi:hypothetical protein